MNVSAENPPDLSPMNAIIKYLQERITPEDTPADRCCKWQLDRVKQVDAVSITRIFSPAKVKAMKALQKQCYYNAVAIALENEGFMYVEGYLLPRECPVPMPHAWNKDARGNYFDVTTEIMLEKKPGDAHRFAVFETKDGGILKKWLHEMGRSPMLLFYLTSVEHLLK